ncbi:MAG: dihydroorotate dehydrogenase electron transfer subunit, partial [Duncaniella sp.]|nr:dihydroorotate dehydrogenase electron transfer subunit [Duncaniella sp.]
MKQVKDFKIIRVKRFNDMYSHLTLTPADNEPLPTILPGQFVQVAPDTNGVLLRRPISINDVNVKDISFDLLVRKSGKGSEA